MEYAEEDEVLIARLVAGDVAALDPLYDRYAGVIFGLLVRIVGDRQVAEDLLQEVLLRAWQRAASYQRPRGRVLTWLLGIAHHLAIDEVRRRQRRPTYRPEREEEEERQLNTVPAPGIDVPEQAWEHLRRVQVMQALARLPTAQRTVIELAYFDGYTQTQIATRLAEPLGTVKTRLRLGLRKLREILQDQGLTIEAD